MNRKLILALAALVVLLGGTGLFFWLRPAPVKITPGRCERCNVILISIDSLRKDHMSLYGYKRKTTPNIDAWAKNAMVFSNYFATSYLTPISEGSVHTGLYPEVSGLTSFRRPIDSGIKTLAEIFKDNGYRTAAVGTSPEFVNFEAVRKSFDRGYDIYQISKTRLAKNRTPAWPMIRKLFRESDEPFLLWFNLGDVHAPFGALAENKFADPAYKGPFAAMQFFTNMQFYYNGLIYDPFAPLMNFKLVAWRDEKPIDIHDTDKEWAKDIKWPLRATPADMAYVVDTYDNGVAEADREVANLFRLLNDLDLAKNTVVILQAEHGESLGERGYIAHYDILDESVRVPLVLSSPALESGQSEIMVSGVDVLPTLLNHVGIDGGFPYPIDGVDIFAPGGKIGPGREEVFLTRTPLWESIIRAEGGNKIFDRFRALDDQIGFKDHAIRTRDEKLIHRTARLAEEQFSCWGFVSGKPFQRNEFEYFDLKADPGEKSPRPGDSSAAKALAERLDRWKANIKSRIRQTPVTPLVQDYQ